MVKPLSLSAIDVALWFLHQAAKENMRLQPAGLHSLLFVSYGLYATTYQGHKLMPAQFLIGDFGPIESSVYRLLELDIDGLYDHPDLPESAEKFLMVIWNRYAGSQMEKLIDFANNHPSVKQEQQRNGYGAQINDDEMLKHFKKNLNREEKTVMVTEDGRELKEWRPKNVNEVVPRIKRQLAKEQQHKS